MHRLTLATGPCVIARPPSYIGAVTRIAEHWDNVYSTKETTEVSWFQSNPEMSLRLVTSVSTAQDAIVDVGAGASTLVDGLLELGYAHVTVLDASASALATVRRRLAGREGKTTFVVADVVRWIPPTTFDVWHDRAVFHFMTEIDSRRAYERTAALAVREGGSLIVGTFAEDGPESCSGLPVVRYSAESLAAQFRFHFDLRATESEIHLTPWGSEQRFTWVIMTRNGTPVDGRNSALP